MIQKKIHVSLDLRTPKYMIIFDGGKGLIVLFYKEHTHNSSKILANPIQKTESPREAHEIFLLQQ